MEWSEATDSHEWDEFVTRHGGSLFHTWSWRKVLEGRGSKPLYMVCRNPQRVILAAIPYVYAPAHRYAHLDTLPYTYMAGPVVSVNERDTLEVLASLPRSVGFSFRRPVIALHITTHQARVVVPMQALGFECREDPYGLLITDLVERPPEHIWSSGFEKHDRQAVKYYETRGSLFRLSGGRADYETYLALELGPQWNPFGQRGFFQDMDSMMLEGLKIALVSVEGRAVAALLFLADPGISTLHLLTIRYSIMNNIHSPVTLANWKVVNWARENGFRYVDFGIWLGTHTTDPSFHAYRLKRRFEATYLPRFKFTVRPSGAVYTLARRINRVVRRVRGTTA